MTPAPSPVPAEIPALGVTLAVVGQDSNGMPSINGLTEVALTCDDPNGVFSFVSNPDQLGATLIPVAGIQGTATITFTAGTTLADGNAGAAISAIYVAAVTPGNAVSVILEATNITAPA